MAKTCDNSQIPCLTVVVSFWSPEPADIFARAATARRFEMLCTDRVTWTGTGANGGRYPGQGFGFEFRPP